MKVEGKPGTELPSSRRSFRPHIPEIEQAAGLLSSAAEAHLRGDGGLAESMIKAADMPALRDWLESIWGKASPHIHFRTVDGAPVTVERGDRTASRMPDAEMKRLLIERDGHHCRLCGTPVIRREVRQYLNKAYQQGLPWGKRNIDQHAAFQVMWLQYDHLLPHARGGTNDLGNMLVACAACNFGRMNFTLEEVGFASPEAPTAIPSSWDGLERLLPHAEQILGVPGPRL